MRPKQFTLPKKFTHFKPFADQLKDGDICDLRTAAKIIGLSEQHLRRLCAVNSVPHIRRNGSQLYFTPANIESVFEIRNRSSRK